MYAYFSCVRLSTRSFILNYFYIYSFFAFVCLFMCLFVLRLLLFVVCVVFTHSSIYQFICSFAFIFYLFASIHLFSESRICPNEKCLRDRRWRCVLDLIGYHRLLSAGCCLQAAGCWSTRRHRSVILMSTSFRRHVRIQNLYHRYNCIISIYLLVCVLIYSYYEFVCLYLFIMFIVFLFVRLLNHLFVWEGVCERM